MSNKLPDAAANSSPQTTLWVLRLRALSACREEAGKQEGAKTKGVQHYITEFGLYQAAIKGS